MLSSVRWSAIVQEARLLLLLLASLEVSTVLVILRTRELVSVVNGAKKTLVRYSP